MNYKTAESLRLRAMALGKGADERDLDRFSREAGASPADFAEVVNTRIMSVYLPEPDAGIRGPMFEAMKLVCDQENRLAIYLATVGERVAVIHESQAWFLQQGDNSQLHLMYGAVVDEAVVDVECLSSRGLDWVDWEIADLNRHADLVGIVSDEVFMGAELQALTPAADDPELLVFSSPSAVPKPGAVEGPQIDITGLAQQAAAAIESGDPADAQRFVQATGMQPMEFSSKATGGQTELLVLAIRDHHGAQREADSLIKLLQGASDSLTSIAVALDSGDSLVTRYLHEPEKERIFLQGAQSASQYVLEMCNEQSVAKWLSETPPSERDAADVAARIKSMAEGLRQVKSVYRVACSGDLSEAPFPLVGEEAQIYFEGKQWAYEDALGRLDLASVLHHQYGPDIMEGMSPPWSDKHRQAARREGWDILGADENGSGPWQLQQFGVATDPPSGQLIDSDAAAWRLVMKGRDPHHEAARAFIKQHNPLEWDGVQANAHDPDEVIVKLADGCTLRSGVFDPNAEGALTAGEYVRLCDADGVEVCYWEQSEWKDDPALVMGAIMNAAAGSRISPELKKDESPSPGW